MGEGRIGYCQFVFIYLFIVNIYLGLEVKGLCMYFVLMLKYVGRFNEVYFFIYVLYLDFVLCVFVGYFGLKCIFENGNWFLVIMGVKFNID